VACERVERESARPFCPASATGTAGPEAQVSPRFWYSRPLARHFLPNCQDENYFRKLSPGPSGTFSNCLYKVVNGSGQFTALLQPRGLDSKGGAQLQ